MNKQWMLAGGIVVALAIGGWTLTHAGNGGVVGVDSPAPDFRVVKVASHDTISLRDTYRGQVTLVNIWATWCAPCREEMPSMEALYQDFRAQGFKIAAVSIDEGDDAAVQAFATELGLSFDILHDRSGGIQGAYQTTGVPESFLLDKDGRIVRRLIGSHDWNSPANRDLIGRLLADGS
ncbi:MAG TPA: TlpA disulfide reductase family protein [Gemmatimonadales bacterium]|nr:TlpA disulfide reductase family protein [Gemmatimonadales bacterium]